MVNLWLINQKPGYGTVRDYTNPAWSVADTRPSGIMVALAKKPVDVLALDAAETWGIIVSGV